MITSDPPLNTWVPLTHWIIVVLWATVLFLLVRKARVILLAKSALILVIILAIDAVCAIFENIYLGALPGARLGFLPAGTAALANSPLLMPTLVNMGGGFVALFLLARHWHPALQGERKETEPRESGMRSPLHEQLENERKKLAMVEAVSKVGSWETDLSTGGLTWSDETFRVLGAEPNAFVPTHERFLNLVHPDDREKVDSAFKASLGSREPCTVEHRIITSDGREKVVVESWQVQADAAGKPLRARGTCQNLTEAKLTADAIKSAADLLLVASRVARLGAWSVTNGQERVVWSGETVDIHEEAAGTNPNVETAISYHAPGYRKKVEEAFYKCAHDGTPFDIVSQIITAKQRRVWVRLMGEAERRADGAIERVRGGIQDISADYAKQEHWRLLETAISRLNDVVIITEAYPIDEPGPRIVYANRAVEKCTGYSRAELMGQSPRKLQGLKTQRKELDRIRSALKNHQGVRAELINYTKSGEEYWSEIEIAPVQDEAGSYSHFIAVERDITERKLAEAKADEIGGRLEILINQAKIGIVVFKDFKPIIANQESARMFGYRSDSEILDLRDVRLLFAVEERDRITGYIEDRAKAVPAPEFYSVKGVKCDGTVIELENRAFAMRWGDDIAVCMMLTDVTEQRRIGEKLKQSQRLEAVGQLTGGVAHDFNNLLTVVLGNAELLEEGLSHDQELRGLAQMTKATAKRGAELISRLLSFSRRQPLEPQVVDIGALIAGLESLLRRAVGEAVNIEISGSNAACNAFVDPTTLENAILNLAINARDAMPNGGNLTIEVTNVEILEGQAAKQIDFFPGEYILIVVSDNGSGMSSDTLSHAFEPFFTTKDPGRGSGLGLSMVYGFAKQSMGHVAIYSELGHGTSVKLYLPRSKFGADRKRQEPPSTNLPTGSEKVLLVEDDDAVRDHVAGQLKSLGYDVVSVKGGAEAVEALEKHRFDLLFTDVVMPGGINGPQLAEIARRLRPGLPVLFTSGYSENAIIHHGRLDAGAMLLSKPYERRELAAKLRQVLEPSEIQM